MGCNYAYTPIRCFVLGCFFIQNKKNKKIISLFWLFRFCVPTKRRIIMEEQKPVNVSQTQEKKSVSTNKLVKISMLSAIAFALQYISFSIPIFPNFLKIDISDVPAVIGGLLYGPMSVIVIEAIKNVLTFVIKGSYSGGVGEVANFLIGVALVAPAIYIYKKNPSMKSYKTGAAVGTVCMCVAAGLLNYFVLIPLYASLFGQDVQVYVDMANAIFSFIDTYNELILFSIVPFNILKALIIWFVSGLMLKYVKFMKA